jgi:hypothetical protein
MNGPLRVLVGCESSGQVRRAMRELGHDAWSCDLLAADDNDPHHIQGDVLDVIDGDWDIGIFHPPCTYLSLSGVRWLHTKAGRWEQMIDGALFFRALLRAPIPRVAVENPKPHRYARKIIGRNADQSIQPWMFGHPETKETRLWLRGLPPLIGTEDSRGYMESLPPAERARIHYASPGPDRWKLRSETYPGIARAMAEQWAGDAREVAA